MLGVNTRANLVGGERVSPILTEKSMERKLVFFDETRAFENQLPSTVYLDFTMTKRMNRNRHSSVWAIQLKNALAEPMAEGYNYNYNYKTETVTLDKSVVVIPSISYAIEF